MENNKFKRGDMVKFLKGSRDGHIYWISGYMQNMKGDWYYSLERAGLKHLKPAKEDQIEEVKPE